MSAYDYRFDHCDTRAEERDREEGAAAEEATFAAMTFDQQEEFIQAERLVFLAASARVTPFAAATAWASSQGLREVA